MEYERRAYLETELANKIKKSEVKGKVMAINLQQIVAREEAKKESLVQAEREKKQVEDVVQQIVEEDRREKESKLKKQKETQELLQLFMKEQEVR